MCLTKIKETYDTPSMMVMDGWKEFVGTSSSPQFSAFALNGSNKVPLDKWLTATDENAKEVRASDGNMYKPGFHVYADEKEMKSANKRRVFVRRVSCRGIDGSKECIIAQEMYVPSKDNGWPPKDDDQSFMDKVKNVLPGNA